ncbi:hypothetical protein HYC85_010648 [Camellia sinensis]|uniref:Very-long-chain aldehyde decarbonylase CER1-like C-terminal domain-containing protein n=1 Tax=Camellia sinensis TaxID=4442 RepID=A0A7J7HL32_CAMSI|nr:hypothetical protein HYC85_010648 [Camellia sinensis]
MASKPGVLTDWPWKHLGSFKYMVLAPWVVHSIYSYMMKDEKERDLGNLLIFPFLMSRMLHNQIWISFSRYRTAKGTNRIVDKTIDFEQVDRESNWDDQILFNGTLFYVGNMALKGASHLPIWRTDGVIITILLHMGPVEFLYYWLHRALHHHYLYSRYHSHHHSSIVTEPISCHCNFELIPKRLFSLFPPLKYLVYTPSFHSLHHTQFRTNYSLFMPIYDHIYDTLDKSTDTLYETSLRRPEESPDAVHLTHLTTPESIYHLRLGFASLASRPQASKWYLWVMWPVTFWSMMVTRIYGRTFVVERNIFGNLKLQTWAIPKYNIQYLMQWQRESINSLIEDAIMEAEGSGIRGEELNKNGELYIRRNPQLKVKVVDGSSLAVAVVLNSIPKGTTQVLLRGILSKVSYSIALALCQRGIQVSTLYEDEYNKLKLMLGTEASNNLFLAKTYAVKTWLVGEGLREGEQMKALKGTMFIPFSQFPPQKIRSDCFYHYTPSLATPKYLQNVDSCENWLPRRVMSAWRIAGIIHALEGWNVNECGNFVFNIDKVWEATIRHGFHPLKLLNHFDP